MDTTMCLQVPDQEGTDKYTASIELSNACRQFYKSRVEAANCIKTRWERNAAHVTRRTSGNDNDHTGNRDNSNTSRKQRNSIDEAMEKLRTEMASSAGFQCDGFLVRPAKSQYRGYRLKVRWPLATVTVAGNYRYDTSHEPGHFKLTLNPCRLDPPPATGPAVG
ncbi:hypothetical protein BaRGS_00018270 [Batillaria attramentaria]|uniref:Uncharacterized protein n=1 Tax=Batillaria attramentaria TaxID=370345 RepID=A0ABD0KTH6_9CAEN